MRLFDNALAQDPTTRILHFLGRSRGRAWSPKQSTNPLRAISHFRARDRAGRHPRHMFRMSCMARNAKHMFCMSDQTHVGLLKKRMSAAKTHVSYVGETRGTYTATCKTYVFHAGARNGKQAPPRPHMATQLPTGQMRPWRGPRANRNTGNPRLGLSQGPGISLYAAGIPWAPMCRLCPSTYAWDKPGQAQASH